MTENESSSARWTVAVLASVILHAGVIGLFVMPGCNAGKPPSGKASESAEAVAPEQGSSGDALAGGDAAPGAESASVASAGEQPSPSGASARPVGSGEQQSASSSREQSRPDAAASIPEFYVVKQGDTLTKIAKTFGTTPDEIASANGKPVRQMDRIWVGQKIRLRRQEQEGGAR